MYEVVWLETALDELADLWVAADSALRQTIEAAVHSINQQLERDPQNCGESRPQGRRVVFAIPLGATFEVSHHRRVVRVLHVWLIRKRP